jgi:serine phosphatase RsbU (regulator of sigma subunit)/integral membrane sensor domain MASE1/anti-sigma regulatory factor (Ser/Thr protein kinase)
LRWRTPALRGALLFLCVGGLYAAGSLTAFAWFNASGETAVFFPSAGITLSALVLNPVHRWPIVLAAAATAEVTIDLAHDIDIGPACGYALANTVEPFIGATLLRRFAPHLDLSHLAGLLAFFACAVVAAPAAGATLGAINNELTDGSDWVDFWLSWWIGDGLGVLVVASAALALAPVVRSGEWPAPEWIQLLVPLTIVVGGGVFWVEELALAFLAIALLAWIAFAIGTAGVAIASFGIAFATAQATAQGHGFFDAVGVSADTGLIYLQLALGFLIGGALALAAAIAERDRSMRAFGRSEVERRRAQTESARTGALSRVVEALALATDQRAIADETLALGLPVLGGIDGAVYLGEIDSGGLNLVAERHEPRADAASPRDTWLSLAADAPAARAARHGEEARGAATGLADAELAIPLRLPPTLVGALVVRGHAVAGYGDAERAYLEGLAQRCEQALGRARLRHAERQVLTRTELLQRMAARMAVALTRAEIAHIATEETAAALEAKSALLVATDENGSPVVAGGTGYATAEIDRLDAAVRAAADLPVTRAMATGETVWFGSRDQGLAMFPDLEHLPGTPAAALAVPLRYEDDTVGSLVWEFEHPRAFNRDLTVLARAAASQCALAIERARLSEVEHRFAREVQSAMLPRTRSVPGEVELATYYQASERHLEVGGDWYDVTHIGKDEVVVAIGDVVGRGLHASAAMGQLRSAASALARTTTGPAEVLAGLDSFAADTRAAMFSTACCARFDVATGVLRYAAAGHPPPLLVSSKGCIRLDAGRSLPLCFALDARPEGVASVPPRAIVAFYTDGLVERRRESIDTGIDRLAAVLEEAVAGDGITAEEVIARTLGDTPAEDDVALVLLRFDPAAVAAGQASPTPQGVHNGHQPVDWDAPGATRARWVVAADPARLAGLRGEVAAWFERSGIPTAALKDVQLAVTEAVTNSILHAYADVEPGSVAVTGAFTGDRVLIEVIDEGSGVVPRYDSPGLGMGLPIISRLADHLDIGAGPDDRGTRVRMSFDLEHPRVMR